MAIKIKTATAPDPVSPHGEAAVLVQQGHSVVQESNGESTLVSYTEETGPAPVPASPPVPLERVGVEMGFKMPVASYTMVEFKVWREVVASADQADTAYGAVKEWVEDRINALVADQQGALPQ